MKRCEVRDPELTSLIHRLWGKARESECSYEKKDWNRLRELLAQYGVIV